jgi:UDP:flavonoid glycosyltransferase YjiC (YdhE family)
MPSDGKAKKKILFANIPADGHFSPLTGVAVHLRDAGHDVRWYTGPSYAPRIEKLDIPYYLFSKAKEVTVHNIDEVFPERKTIKNLVREKLNKHTVTIGILPLCESSRQLPPPVMGLTPSRNPAGKAVHALLRLLTDKLLFKKPHALIDKQFGRFGMERKGKNLFDVQIDKSTLFLQSGTPGFEYKRDTLSPHIHFIGPLLPYTNKEPYVLKFEDKLRTYSQVLLVTQGTFEADVNKLIVPAIEAFNQLVEQYIHKLPVVKE